MSPMHPCNFPHSQWQNLSNCNRNITSLATCNPPKTKRNMGYQILRFFRRYWKINALSDRDATKGPLSLSEHDTLNSPDGLGNKEYVVHKVMSNVIGLDILCSYSVHGWYLHGLPETVSGILAVCIWTMDIHKMAVH